MSALPWTPSRSLAWTCRLALAAAGAAAALSQRAAAVSIAALGAGAAGMWLLKASIRRPAVFIALYLVVLEVLPPLFPGGGSTPLYPSFLLLPVGLLAAVSKPGLRSPALKSDPVAAGLLAFALGTAMSLPFAWWLSGTAAGFAALSRWFLLVQGLAVFCFIRRFHPEEANLSSRPILPALFIGAAVSAAYGIVDFVRPIPIPHPAAEQFIWLGTGVLRRAQGVFYESSNFGNFCGMFVIAAYAAILSRRTRDTGVPKPLLVSCALLLSIACLVAFSRSVWAGTLAALFCYAVLAGMRIPRWGVLAAGLAIPLLLLWAVSPELWDYLVASRMGRLASLFSDPDTATSGRFETWVRVLAIMREFPGYLVFGIGYKTLPVTRLFHGEIITDNGYLSLLLETGAIGLGGFAILTAAILKTFLALARRSRGAAAFWSAVLVSLWCGQLVLLLAADAYSYWRNFTLYAALMALTLNHSELADRSARPGSGP